LDTPADDVYGALLVALEAAGQPIGANDLFITAHAHSLKLTLVTANVRAFSRVQGLNFENWLTAS
jgi:tRNA(fMet)-specific endonuclease VapC